VPIAHTASPEATSCAINRRRVDRDLDVSVAMVLMLSRARRHLAIDSCANHGRTIRSDSVFYAEVRMSLKHSLAKDSNRAVSLARHAIGILVSTIALQRALIECDNRLLVNDATLIQNNSV